MANIVKYDNDLNLTQHFNKLNQMEQDIFFAVTSEFTKKNEKTIEIKINDLRKKAGMQKNYKPNEIVKFINTISVKLASMVFTVSKGDEKIIGALFSVFIINKETGILKIKLNTDFLNYFSDVPFSFTQFELQHFLLLNSKYAKILFRYLLDLKHFAHKNSANDSRYWKIDFEEFKKLMTFPKSYRTSVIIKTVNKAVQEINDTEYISNLTIEKEIGPGTGQPIKNLIFTYNLNKDFSLLEKSGKNDKDLLECPYCGSAVIKKSGKNGEFYGHKYYKQTECKHSWSTLEDLNNETELVKKAAEELEKKKEKFKKNEEKAYAMLVKEREELFNQLGVLEDEDTYNE